MLAMQGKFRKKPHPAGEKEAQGRNAQKIHENFTEKLQIMLAFSKWVGYII